MASCQRCRGLVLWDSLYDGESYCANCGDRRFHVPVQPNSHGNGINRHRLLLDLPITFKLSSVIDAWRAEGGSTYAELRVELEAEGFAVARVPNGDSPGPLWARRGLTPAR
jgi:hypothetical protein